MKCNGFMSCDHNKGKVRTENACRVVTSNVRREMVSRFPNISMIAGHQNNFFDDFKCISC